MVSATSIIDKQYFSLLKMLILSYFDGLSNSNSSVAPFLKMSVILLMQNLEGMAAFSVDS
jgi:hypothetical protein